MRFTVLSIDEGLRTCISLCCNAFGVLLRCSTMRLQRKYRKLTLAWRELFLSVEPVAFNDSVGIMESEGGAVFGMYNPVRSLSGQVLALFIFSACAILRCD